MRRAGHYQSSLGLLGCAGVKVGYSSSATVDCGFALVDNAALDAEAVEAVEEVVGVTVALADARPSSGVFFELLGEVCGFVPVVAGRVDPFEGHRFSLMRSRAAWIRWMSRWIRMHRADVAIRFPCLSASSHVARVFHARSRMITCHTSPFLRIMGLVIAEGPQLSEVEAGERSSVTGQHDGGLRVSEGL